MASTGKYTSHIAGALQVVVHDPGGTNKYGRGRRCYVASLTGLSTQWRFERKFLSGHVTATAVKGDATAHVPSRPGYYEVQDFVDQYGDGEYETRRRYFVYGMGKHLQVEDWQVEKWVDQGIDPDDAVSDVSLMSAGVVKTVVSDDPSDPDSVSWVDVWAGKAPADLTYGEDHGVDIDLNTQIAAVARDKELVATALQAVRDARAAIADPQQDEEDLMMHLDGALDALEQLAPEPEEAEEEDE